jgi:Cu/Ag efflux protein CusF
MKKLLMGLALIGFFSVTAALVSCEKKQEVDPAVQVAAAAIARSTGVVKGMDASMGRIIVSHEAIPSLKWPAMIMSFRISAELAKDLKEGQKVEFEFEPRDMDGTITKVKVLP